MDYGESLKVDSYLADLLVPADPVLDAVLAANAAGGLPPHDVSPLQGKLLYLLARIAGARRILEIGTLGAYSTIWLARALPEGGRIVTLEVNAEHAQVASANIIRAGLEDRVDLRKGPALESLKALESEGAGPFDLIFIDADKPSNSEYLKWALRLSRVGTVIVGDNVVRNGAILDPDGADPNVLGVRCFLDNLSAARGVSATAAQTVGAKGWDGFVVALVEAIE